MICVLLIYSKNNLFFTGLIHEKFGEKLFQKNIIPRSVKLCANFDKHRNFGNIEYESNLSTIDFFVICIYI